MECKFWVGQKVCYIGGVVRRNDRNLPATLTPLKLGMVYTIRQITTGQFQGREHVGVYLHEIYNGLHASGKEFGYVAFAFRPATDISDLQKIVEKVFNGKKVAA